MNNFTRFRAYQLGNAGGSCTYAVDSDVTLIEARLNEQNESQLMYELQRARTNKIQTLHITSWDADHCNAEELSIILDKFNPSRIELPGYDPDTQNGQEALKLIFEYNRLKNSNIFSFTPEYICSLPRAERNAFQNVVFGPLKITEKHNDNSNIKLFRYGRFNVLSLGDCESCEISERLQKDPVLQNEVDVLVLAHHGADNGFTTREFLKFIKPKIAVCTANWSNQYDHPSPRIRALLTSLDIPLITTKAGDVLITCGNDNNAEAYNMIANNEKYNNKISFRPKKASNCYY